MVRETIESTPADVTRRALRGVVALGIRQATTQGANVVGSILLARLLSPAEFGLFAVLTFAVSFLNSFGGTGLAANFIRDVREPSEDDYRALFGVQEFVVLVTAAAFYAAASEFARLYHLTSSGAWLFRLTALSFALTSLMVVPQVRLERHLNFGRLAFVETGQALLYNGTAVVLAWRGYGALSFALAVMIRAATGVVLVNLMSPWSPKVRWDWPRARRHLAFGLPYQGIAVVSLIKDSVNPVFVGLLLGTQNVGYLSWAGLLANYPVVGLLALQRLYLPMFARLQAAPDLGRSVERTIAATNALVAPLAVLTLVLVHPIVHLVFGDKWTTALPIFYILWIGNFFVATATPLLGLLNALGQAKTALLFATVWMVGTWVLAPPLVAAVGVVGFAWANLCIQATNLLLFRAAQARVQFHILPSVMPSWLWAALMGLGMSVTQHIWPATQLAPLVAYLLCGLTTYTLGIVVMYRRNLAVIWLSWRMRSCAPAPQ